MSYFKSIFLLTVLCFVINHGIIYLLYLFVACVCFLTGFSVAKSETCIFYSKPKCSKDNGIQKVLQIMGLKNVVQPDICISNNRELNDAINEVICLVVKDYIQDWYNSVTPDRAFPVEVHKSLLTLVSNISKRMSNVDWIPFLTEVIPSQLASHIRLYRIMLERKPFCPDRSPMKLFFDAECDAEKSICREDICCLRDKELDHLRRISERFLYFITPLEEYRIPSLRYFARELLLNAIILPLVDLFSSPDFVNQTISWFAYDSSYTSEYFCQALRMSESTEELEVVNHELDTFMKKLRGHDTGGENDALIKAQLGSLDFVKKICHTRLNYIKQGVAEKLESVFTYHLQPGVKLYDMSFDELMSKSVGVVNFLDFLTSIDKQSLLRLYLNCVSFRENAANLCSAEPLTDTNVLPSILTYVDVASSMENVSCNTDVDITSCLSSSPPSSSSIDIFDPMSLRKSDISAMFVNNTLNDDVDNGDGDHSDSTNYAAVEANDLNCINESDNTLACDKKFFNLDQPSTFESNFQDENESVEQLRGFGITLCSNLLHYLPLSVESLIQQTLRNLTTQDGPPSADAFTEIEKYLVEMLSGPQYLGEFKRTSHYVYLLGEMDLLKEPVEQSSSTLVTSLPANVVSNHNTRLFVSDFTTNPELSPSSSSNKSADSSNLSIQLNNSINFNGTNPSVGLTNQGYLSNQVAKCSSATSIMLPGTDATRNSLSNGIFTAEIIHTEIVRDLFTVYTLGVNYTSTSTREVNTWNTLRRFRHFVELLSFINNRCGRIPELKLPSKIALNNMSQDVLAQRRRGLNRFLATLCNPEFLAAHPPCRPLLTEFLKPNNWEGFQGQGQFVSALLAPLRSVGNAVMSVPDTLADGLNKIFTGKGFGSPNTTNSLNLVDDLGKRSNDFEMEDHSDIFLADSTRLSTSDSIEISGDETPLRILFQLVEEIFDLHQKSLLVRQGNFAIIKKLVQTFFGFRMNKMIVAKVDELTSASRITQLIIRVRDYLWPPTDALQVGERDRQMKLRTRVLCRTTLLGSISEELAQFLGNETRRRGVSRVFNLLQEECLNRRFIHLILELFLCELFKPYQANWDNIFATDLCPLRTGRYCRLHKTIPKNE